MKRVHQWLATEATRQSSFPLLEHALLTDRAFGYVYFRLRYMWLRVFVRCAVHMLELTLLSSAVPEDWLLIFIGYRTVAGLLSSLYWGALEQLRESVRDHLRHRNIGSARLSIHNWLRVSAVLAVVGVVTVSVWIAWAPSEFQRFSVFDLFGLVCFVRLGFELWARTLHSGIFASRRVYRPLWSVLAPDLTEIALLVVLFPPFGLLSFVAMVVVGGIVRIGLTNYFSKRAYRGSRIKPPTVRETFSARNVLARRDMSLAAKFALSNATSQLDGVIIMLLLLAANAGGEAAMLFASTYYVLRPLMAVAHNWVRAFYVDLRRIDGQCRLFQRRFRSLMSRTAVAMACGVVLLVLLATSLLSGGLPSPALLLLAPFFVARSLWSLRQLDAFASAQHAALIRVSLALLLALHLIAWWSSSATALMITATVLMIAGGFALPTASDRRQHGSVVGLPRWLALAACAERPMRLTVLTIDRRLTTAPRLIRRLVPRIESAVFARFGHSHVLVAEPAAAAVLASASNAAVSADGALTEFRSVVVESGAPALRTAIDGGAFPRDLNAMLATERGSDLLADYRRQCPGGTVIEAKGGRLSGGKGLGTSALRAIMRAISIQSRGGAEAAHHRLDVLVYAPGGEPETIFVTPIEARPSVEFRRRVQAATLRASLGDTLRGQPTRDVAQTRP